MEPSFAKTVGIDQRGKARPKEPITLPYDKMANDDLPMTKPNSQIFKTCRTGTNPLDPIYKLPQSEGIDNPDLPFYKDPLNVGDIPGARSKWIDQAAKRSDVSLRRQQPTQALQTLKETEIKRILFSSMEDQPKRVMWSNPSRNPLDVTDIERPKKFDMTRRCVNPVQPEYHYFDAQKQPALLEPIHKSTSSILHKKLNKVSYGLMSADILGATSETSGNPVRKAQALKDPRPTNYIQDIENVAPGTFKKGISTKRITNPMEPDYRLPASFTDGFCLGSEYLKGLYVAKKGKAHFQNQQSAESGTIKEGLGKGRSSALAILARGRTDTLNLQDQPILPSKSGKRISHSTLPKDPLVGINVKQSLFLPVDVRSKEIEFLSKYCSSVSRRLTVQNAEKTRDTTDGLYQMTAAIKGRTQEATMFAHKLDQFIVRRT
jgi:hypothetical protein